MRVPLLRADTMTARYISPELRARIYSVRFFVGFLGSAAAAPVVSIFYERNGSVAAVTMVRDVGLRALLPEPQGGAGAGAVGGRITRRGRIAERRETA